MLQVAVGLVQDDHQRILMTSRPAGKVYAGWWEFPGGKIEAGETVAQALARELDEELGLHLQPEAVRPLGSRDYVYPHAHVALHFCLIRDWHGPEGSLRRGLALREGQQACWVDFGRRLGHSQAVAMPYPVLPASLPLIRALEIAEGHLEGQLPLDW